MDSKIATEGEAYTIGWLSEEGIVPSKYEPEKTLRKDRAEIFKVKVSGDYKNNQLVPIEKLEQDINYIEVQVTNNGGTTETTVIAKPIYSNIPSSTAENMRFNLQFQWQSITQLSWDFLVPNAWAVYSHQPVEGFGNLILENSSISITNDGTYKYELKNAAAPYKFTFAREDDNIFLYFDEKTFQSSDYSTFAYIETNFGNIHIPQQIYDTFILTELDGSEIQQLDDIEIINIVQYSDMKIEYDPNMFVKEYWLSITDNVSNKGSIRYTVGTQTSMSGNISLNIRIKYENVGQSVILNWDNSGTSVNSLRVASNAYGGFTNYTLKPNVNTNVGVISKQNPQENIMKRVCSITINS